MDTLIEQAKKEICLNTSESPALDYLTQPSSLKKIQEKHKTQLKELIKAFNTPKNPNEEAINKKKRPDEFMKIAQQQFNTTDIATAIDNIEQTLSKLKNRQSQRKQHK